MSPPAPAWQAPAPSVAETLARLRARSESFRTVRAVLDLAWKEDADSTSEECRASLSWVRPDSLRLRGTTAAFFTVFDLAADARHVRLDVPREHVAVFGERNDPAWEALPLSAEELLVALLADPCAEGGCGDSVRWIDEPGRILGGPGWTLELDPSSGYPRRWTRANARAPEIFWSDWVVRDGIAWPLQVSLRDAARGERVEVHLGRVDLDRPIPADRFSLSIDSDREILTPAEAQTRWERQQGRGVFHPK
ncbi:MAG: hypothetical protein U0167_03775 [bacterium]